MFRIVIGNFWLVGEEMFISGYQGCVIIGVEVVLVFYYKVFFVGFGNVMYGRQVVVWEDIFIDLWVNVMVGDFGVNGVQ